MSHEVALARWEEMPRNNEKLLVRAMLGNTNGGKADRWKQRNGRARHYAPMAEVMRGGRGLERCGADDGISTSWVR